MKGKNDSAYFFLSALFIMALGTLKVIVMGDAIRDN